MTPSEIAGLIKYHLRPAIEEITEWYGPKNHSLRAWHVERYIWRDQDAPLFRVALGEALATTMTNTRIYDDINTRFLEYVPTGKIMYAEVRGRGSAILFEYRLKESRELRA